MGSDHVVAMLRHTIETALWMGAPLLIAATVVGLADQCGAGADFAAGHRRYRRCPVCSRWRPPVPADAVDGAPPHRISLCRLFSDFRPFVR